MADIELVIKIPEEMYAEVIDENGIDTMLIPYKDIVLNGTPLPKGHGRLIDADDLMKRVYRIDDSLSLSSRDVINEEDIDDAPTIIEANKGSEVDE